MTGVEGANWSTSGGELNPSLLCRYGLDCLGGKCGDCSLEIHACSALAGVQVQYQTYLYRPHAARGTSVPASQAGAESQGAPEAEAPKGQHMVEETVECTVEELLEAVSAALQPSSPVRAELAAPKKPLNSSHAADGQAPRTWVSRPPLESYLAGSAGP